MSQPRKHPDQGGPARAREAWDFFLAVARKDVQAGDHALAPLAARLGVSAQALHVMRLRATIPSLCRCVTKWAEAGGRKVSLLIHPGEPVIAYLSDEEQRQAAFGVAA